MQLRLLHLCKRELMGGLFLTAGSLPITSGGAMRGKEVKRTATSSHLKKSLEDMEKRRFAT